MKTASGPGIHPNEVPALDWGLLKMRPSPCHPIEASKGCRYRCAFCSYPDLGNQRMRDPGRVVEELIADRNRFGIKTLRFVDSNLTSWPDYTEELCDKIIQAGIDVQWGCFARVDNFARAPRLAEKMRRAGCFMVYCGIESGDDGILRSMRKGYNSQTVLEGVRRAKQAGLLVHGFFIIGFPGETTGSVDRTLDVIRRSDLDTVRFSPFYVSEGSQALTWTQKEKWGLEGTTLDWRHSTMDSQQAIGELERALDVVDQEFSQTVIALDRDIMSLVGWGFSPQEAKGYYAAARDWRRGRATNDSALMASSEAALRRVWTRVDSQLGKLDLLRFEDPPREPTRPAIPRLLSKIQRLFVQNAGVQNPA